MAKSTTLSSLPAEAAEFEPLLQQLVAENAAADNWHSRVADLPAYQQVRAQDAATRGRLALAALAVLRSNPGRRATTMVKLLEALMRSTVALSGADFVTLFTGYGLRFPAPATELIREALHVYPVAYTLGQVEKEVKKNGLSEPLASYLAAFLAATQHELTGYLAADVAKLQRRLQGILGAGQPDGLPVLTFAEGDALGRHLTREVAALPPADPATGPKLRLLQLWQQASGGQPTAKYQRELDAAVAALGAEATRAWGGALLATLAALRPEPVTSTSTYRDQTYTRTDTVYLLGPSQSVAKGLIWTLGPLADAPLQALLADYGAYCFQKVPARGALAPALANACLWALAAGGLPGIMALARVRGRFRQANTQALIAGYIERAAATLGVTPTEIEDLAVPDFNLENGQATETFGDYTATLSLAGGRAEVAWRKHGQPLKAAPAALKASHADELKELKAAQTQAQQTFTAQRDRLDRSFIDERRIAWPWFEQHYFQHGLLRLLACPLIWRLHHPGGTHHDALWLHGNWCNAQGQPVPAPTADTQVQLWHPVLVSTAEVLAWRALLDAHQLRQPLRQAYREVYLLTPPEERTRTYSNRMAAHILRQHQFNSLAKLRHWHYQLLGAYDKGYESDKAALALPAHHLTAEFWVSEVNTENAWNDTGIWHYVSTDQVRFVRQGAAVPLPEVPALPFSEVMRDVDLFVGVASVGNDPLWRDQGGLPQYRDYWNSYSFGELGEVAKTRRLALERLLPRLQVGRASTLTDRFLEVQGKYHLYKIHLGSGNILMADGDRYLCIVPDRSPKAGSPTAPDVFLPFEGDAVLSIILSKAVLLLNDDKITDETIVRQIRPR